MRKIAISFFASSFVFLAIAIVFFVQKNVSLATFLIFYLFGFASGCFLGGGIALSIASKKIKGVKHGEK